MRCVRRFDLTFFAFHSFVRSLVTWFILSFRLHLMPSRPFFTNKSQMCVCYWRRSSLLYVVVVCFPLAIYLFIYLSTRCGGCLLILLYGFCVRFFFFSNLRLDFDSRSARQWVVERLLSLFSAGSVWFSFISHWVSGLGNVKWMQFNCHCTLHTAQLTPNSSGMKFRKKKIE